MRNLLKVTLLLLVLNDSVNAQDKLVIDSSYVNGHYTERTRFFSQLQPPAGNLVVFLGNSITEAGPWAEVLPGVNVVNRGISGDISWGVLARLDSVLALKPAKIFLLIGINELKRGMPVTVIASNYNRIVSAVKRKAPQTKLYLQSVLPVAEQVMSNAYSKISNKLITVLNDSLQQVALRYQCGYVDLYHDVFADGSGQMKRELTSDGIHLKPAGYLQWADYLKRKGYVGTTPAPPQPGKIDSSYNNTYYQGRMLLFNSLPVYKGGIVFLGNSITERGPWWELLPGETVLNRGIGGDNTFGVLARLEGIANAAPRKIFLLIGINDLSRGLPIPVILNNYERILNFLQTRCPQTKIGVQSVLPLNEAVTKADYLKNKKDSILLLNKGIKKIAEAHKLTYLNLHPLFADEKGDLRKELTDDGIHLRPQAYVMWVNFLKKNKFL